MKVVDNPDLKKMSTLGLGGTAGQACYPASLDDLDSLSWIRPDSEKVIILGRGSNTLFREGHKELTLIIWDKAEPPQITARQGQRFRVRVHCGQTLPSFLRWCAESGLSGLESLAGIPGRLGGAIAMNAGSYGTEILELIQKIRIWSPKTGIQDLGPQDIQAGYRSFSLKNNPGHYVILEADLILSRVTPEKVKRMIREVYLKKKSAQPVLERTAGCVFKNPVSGESAGMLLDKAGFRGRRLGGVCFSSMHANFLVNTGKGTSTQALELIQKAREKVRSMFGHDLQMEIRVV
ncbi:MAG: UDP-N-acetylmuramate dehydrogenase [Desulfonatronovibrionaceae bacterium]